MDMKSGWVRRVRVWGLVARRVMTWGLEKSPDMLPAGDDDDALKVAFLAVVRASWALANPVMS